MANLSDKTRKEQVLVYLQERKGEWVDGTDIMNEQVGGQRGGARIFDLRDDGYLIQARRHPDPERDIWQYRLMDREPVEQLPTPLREGAVPEPPPETVPKGPMVFGTHRICPSCRAMRRVCGSCGGKGYIEALPGT